MPLDPAKLKSRRERLNLTQQEVADAAGLQRSFYARLESGIRPDTGKPNDPALSIAESVAKALRCPLAKLMG